jgi:Mrp family chromosome partitioning ATPase
METPPAPTREPVYFRLQENDVLRTLNGIFPLSGGPDIVRLGWPTLHGGSQSSRFTNATLRMASLADTMPKGTPSVIAAVGLGCDDDRTVAVLNVALAATRAGKRVLVIDADRVTRAISKRLNSRVMLQDTPSAAAQHVSVVEVMSGVSLQRLDPSAGGLQHALEAARRSGRYDLILLDGPAVPLAAADHALLDAANGVLVVMPEHMPASEHLQATTSMLPGAEQKLIGVVFSELSARPQEQSSMRISA